MNAWQPTWPGFNARGSLLLPLPAQAFADLAPMLEVDGLSLARKDEFHVTLLDRRTAARMRAQEAGVVAPSMMELFAMQDWQWRRGGERWLLREDKPDGRAHSVIELLELPALNRFRHAVGWAHGEKLADSPAHVTLYVAGDPLGISIEDEAAFQKKRVRLLS
jgi:hypothetical protein